MERLRCRPVVVSPHYSEQAAAYEHLVNLARKQREIKIKGGEGTRGEEKRDRHGRRFSEARGLSPHELQPVGEKLTDFVAQPCSRTSLFESKQ